MKSIAVVAFAAAANAKWNGVAPPAPTAMETVAAAPAAQVTQAAEAMAGNPYAGAQLFANNYYKSEVLSIAIPSLKDKSLAAKASAVAEVPSFFWLDTQKKVEQVNQIIKDAGTKTVQLVVYNMPERDCSAKASNGELSAAADGANKYKAYIDSIAKEIKAAPNTKFVLAFEPDSLGNLVTNLNVPKCQAAEQLYKDSTIYGLKTLNLDNVSIYMDAGHAGWLGWPANLTPAAKLFADIYKAAGSPKAVRGLVTNISNYNAFKAASCPAIAESNQNCDEQKYINAFAPVLKQNGFPAYFIVDTGRTGVQPGGRTKWGNWCNIKNSGFGVRPTANTGDPLVDAFVWIKPGGECDGTTDTTAARYDSTCSSADSLQPAPEAGTWFQEYFEMLVKNANPPL